LSVILHIETSTPVCSVALSQDGIPIDQIISAESNDHASQLAVITKNILDKNDVSVRALAAVSVSAGPGSYTGLRIGASFAKGICHALGIPLIPVNSLEAMAYGAHEIFTDDVQLFAPLIDARRMEVYTALYNSGMECIRKPEAVIMRSNDFLDYLQTYKILFFGSGLDKIRQALLHPRSLFLDKFQLVAYHQVRRASQFLAIDQIGDISAFEPEYIKTFSGKARYSPDI